LDKKTVLAILLIFAVFFLSNKFMNPKPDVAEGEKSKANTHEVVESVPAKAVNSAPVEVVKSRKGVSLNENIALENDKIKLLFSNRGGMLESVYLKGYSKDLQGEIPLNLLAGKAFSVSFDQESYQDYIFDYRLEGNTLRFIGDNFEKVFTLGEDFILDFELNVAGKKFNAYQISMDEGIAETEVFVKGKSRDYGAAAYVENSLESQTLSSFDDETEVYTGDASFVALYNKYFTIGVRKMGFQNVSRTEFFAANDNPSFTFKVLESKDNFSHKYRLYFGPMISENLEAMGGGFEKISDKTWSFLNWLSKFFVKLLGYIYMVIPNYGVAIILFAFVLKTLLYPLTHKMFESTQKMQKIQPLVAEVQKKYKTDKVKMNNELRKVYKEQGVNPLGGCLPLLLQIPVFIALYPALKYSIALRQQPFFGWIGDLAAPDPYYILPVLMGVFMFVQQKFTMASAGDPSKMTDQQRAMQSSQKMMMYGMPVFLVFIFRDFPAGLVLYWTVFNLLSTVQQYFIKKKFDMQ